jgi:hypothetical protein
MVSPLQDIVVRGVHLVTPNSQEFAIAISILWGANLAGEALALAEDNVRQHFDALFLIEIEVSPADGQFDWAQIWQPQMGKPTSEWQAAYDEHRVDQSGGRWAFFLHFVDLQRPISTELGDRQLPKPSPTPAYLSSIRYSVP